MKFRKEIYFRYVSRYQINNNIYINSERGIRFRKKIPWAWVVSTRLRKFRVGK